MPTHAVVTGGCGFLGAAIVEELRSRGDRVTVLDRRASQAGVPEGVTALCLDITDEQALAKAFEGADEVYHLAGKLGTAELDDRAADAVRINILGSLHVFEAARTAGVPVVFQPTKPNVWLNTYTITKVAAEGFGELLRRSGELRVVSLRYFNAYGPRQALGPIRKIMPVFAAAALEGVPLPIFGDGRQTVDMVHAADVARLSVALVRSGYDGPPLDCGSGVGRTVCEVAADVNACVGSHAGTRHLPMRRGEVPGTVLVADMEPLSRLLGPLAFRAWDAGVVETVQWYGRREPEEIRAAVQAFAA